MTLSNDFIAGLNSLFNKGGITTTIKLIRYTINSNDYDDAVTQDLYTSFTTSGLIFPINSQYGSSEAMLLEQGKISTQDKVLYTGSINSYYTGGGTLVEINNEQYSIIPDGVYTYSVAGSHIYNKIFLRKTLTGSLYI